MSAVDAPLPGSSDRFPIIKVVSIAIITLVIVSPLEPIDGGERPMMGFETVTLCPIDRRLIRPALMTERERAWLDAYHAEVRTKLLPLIDDAADRAWLVAATAPLAA